MATLYRYFKDFWKLAVVALILAAINQVFSLLDPLIFRHIIDSYATRYREYSSPQFIRGVSLLLGAAVGVALVSRIAKNFQDYFVNVITQKVGARIYTDGVRHSLDLPYTLFEDQRSGETLGKLQRVRSDVEKFIALLVNMVFTTLIGLVFVTIYATKVHWSIAPAYLLTVPLLGGLSSLLSRRIKTVQKRIVNETTALAGATTESLRNIELVKSLGLAHQEIDRLNSTTHKILKLELKESEVPAEPELCPRDSRERVAHQYFVPHALFDFPPGDYDRAVFLAHDLFVFHLYSATGTRKRDQHLSRDGSVACELPADPRHASRSQARQPGSGRRVDDPPVRAS